MRCTTFRRVARATLLLAAIPFAGCTQRMSDQPRYDPLQRSEFYRDTLSARPLPEGVIPITYAPGNELMDTGMTGGKPSEEFPLPVTRELLERGRQRYNIYCTPCHDYVGTGNGMPARRGFRRHPASFHTDELRAMPNGHFFDVMTNGFGAMPPYSKQITPRDRWAIVGYIRALQLSQAAGMDDVPADQRQQLGAAR